jgi:hypothetical protein
MIQQRGIELTGIIEACVAAKRRPSYIMKENIDTNTSTGKLMFYIIAALAEFEPDVISERIQASLEAARARGRKGRRPHATKKMFAATITHAKELYDSKAMTVAKIMALTGFKKKRAFYKYVVTLLMRPSCRATPPPMKKGRMRRRCSDTETVSHERRRASS